MKTFYWLLALGLFGSIAMAQPSGKTVKLIGIVGLDINCAILEVAQTNHARRQTEQLVLGTNQTQSGIQVQNIDVLKGVVTVTVDGEERTLAFSRAEGAAAEKPSTIRFSDLKLQQVIDFYRQLESRTVLQHPRLQNAGFTLVANPQSRPEAAKALEELFASHQIAAIPDGDRFVMLVPYSLTNQVTPRSKEFAQPGPMLPASSVNFQNVPMQKVLEIYGEFIGHPVKNLQSSPFGLIYLTQQNPLSKAEICYAMGTLIAWNGVGVITNQDNTSSWERIP